MTKTHTGSTFWKYEEKAWQQAEEINQSMQRNTYTQAYFGPDCIPLPPLYTENHWLPGTEPIKYSPFLYILNSHVNLYPDLESIQDFERIYKMRIFLSG